MTLPSPAHRWHGRDPTAWIGWAFGLAFAALALTPGFVLGTGPFWRHLTGDGAQHEIGWFYFARDAWRFPLFAIGNYHLPEGANVALTDSLPLLAVPAKLLFRLFSAEGARPPIYTGAWTALCFVLQAVAASRLLRTLGVTRPVAHAAGLALLCYLPMWLIRFGGHSALLGQFLLLFALDGYFRARRDALGRGGWRALCLLPSLALLVHPYLAAMSGALVSATLLDACRRPGAHRTACALRALGIALPLALVYGIGGYAAFAAPAGTGYGSFSMNLLSPWVPPAQTASGRWLGTEAPSIAGLDQWEGGCYLGAGVLLLVAVALSDLRGVRDAARRHAVLLGVLVAFVLFALSHRIGFGAQELVRIPLPERVVGAFSVLRASGRFAWVPVYVLACWAIVSATRRFGAGRATALLAAAAVLQVLDVGPMPLGIRAASATASVPTIDARAWTNLIRRHESLFQFPSFECGGLFGNGVPGSRVRELEIEWIAAQLGKPTNSAYLARFTKNCVRERAEALHRSGEPGVLYLYRSEQEVGILLERHGVDFSRCGYLDDVVVCSGDADLSDVGAAPPP